MNTLELRVLINMICDEKDSYKRLLYTVKAQKLLKELENGCPCHKGEEVTQK